MLVSAARPPHPDPLPPWGEREKKPRESPMRLPCHKGEGKRGRGDNAVDELIVTRAIHFAATLTAAGVVFFLLGVAEPAFA